MRPARRHGGATAPEVTYPPVLFQGDFEETSGAFRGDRAKLPDVRVPRFPRLRSALSSHPALILNSALVLALIGSGIWAYTFFTEPTASATNDTVRTVAVRQGTVTATVSADGSVASASTASASFATAGTVTGIQVKVGQVVRKGQVLAKIDPTSANRDLEAAEADLTSARDALDRAEGAGDDTSDAEAEVTQAELAVEEAEEAVAGTVLKAPMAGTVVAVNGTLGGSTSGDGGSSGDGSTGGSGSNGASGGSGNQSGGSSGGSSSNSGGGFVDLADLTKLQVTADFAEVDATRLKEGQKATVTWNALTDTEVSGTVASIDPSATSANDVVTYPATVTLDSVPKGARIGQTVSVSVVTGTVADAIYVNSVAVTKVGNRRTVTVLENGRQVTRAVEVGLEGDQLVQITSGLTVGEQVVITSTGSSGGGGVPGGGGFPGGGGVPGGGGFPGGGGPRGGSQGGGPR